MILTFKDKRKYNGAKHAWFCDWYFEPRSKKDVLKLLDGIGFREKEITVTWEPTNVIVFFEVVKH